MKDEPKDDSPDRSGSQSVQSLQPSKVEEEDLPEADWEAANDAAETQSEEGNDHSDECDGPDDDALAQDKRLMGPSVAHLDDAEEDGTPMPGEHFRRFVAQEGTGRWITAANVVKSLYRVSKEKLQDVFKEMTSVHSSGIKSEERMMQVSIRMQYHPDPLMIIQIRMMLSFITMILPWI